MFADAYKLLVKEKQLEEEPLQLELAEIMEYYEQQLTGKIDKESLISRLRKHFKNSQAVSSGKGLYIYGKPGRGKSMLMDLFFRTINIDKKQKIHFHKFMLDFHRDFNAQSTGTKNSAEDFIAHFAKIIAAKTRLLCLDELQINNIADAMIIERLFKGLLEQKVFIVVTSNCQPDQLYADGLQRERLLPFIQVLKEQFVNFHLCGFKDYRLEKVADLNKTYFFPLDKANKTALADIINMLSGDKQLFSREIFIDKQRSLKILRSYGNLAVFHFNELCQMPLGALDYLALTRNFDTLIIEEIPVLSPENHNEALRFITLIDCLYEAHIRLICSAASSIDEIYTGGRNKFEFNRVVSRLKEMQSKEYLSCVKRHA